MASSTSAQGHKMLFAIVKKTNHPIKLVSWFFVEPGKLFSVRDSGCKTWAPWALIPIGYKRYRKMVNEAEAKQWAIDNG